MISEKCFDTRSSCLEPEAPLLGRRNSRGEANVLESPQRGKLQTKPGYRRLHNSASFQECKESFDRWRRHVRGTQKSTKRPMTPFRVSRCRSVTALVSPLPANSAEEGSQESVATELCSSLALASLSD